MRNFLILSVVILMAVVTGCNKPRTIPDSKLESIFKEIFLTNAYVSTQSIRTDSLDIYSPILAKYGYTPDDLTSTLDQFARRKSSRLSDILNSAIDQLDVEYRYYEKKVAAADTIMSRAAERFKEQVLFDTLIRVDRIRDTARLRLSIPVSPGLHKISYSYRVDTTDHNPSFLTSIDLRDTIGRQLAMRTNWMSRDRRSTYNLDLDVGEGAEMLNIHFGGYSKNSSDPHIGIDSLRIYRYLPTEQALTRMRLEDTLLNYSFPVEGLLPRKYMYEKDSITLRPSPLWVMPKADSIP